MSALSHQAGTPLQIASFSATREPRGDGSIRSFGAPQMLTFAVPPEWMRNPEGEVPNCQRTRSWMYGDKDQMWDMDLRNESSREENDEFAANLCAGCPIIGECLSVALAEEGLLNARDRYMVRGGLTPAARAEMVAGERAARPEKIKPILQPCGGDHEAPCRWFAHPNGSDQCKDKVNAQARARRARRWDEDDAA